MTPSDVLPPVPKITDYPAAIGIMFAVVFTAVLVIVASKFDPTMGTLTISMLVVVVFIGTVLFCLFFTVPSNEINSGVIGGLIAAFGAVIAHWLSRHPPRDGPK